MKNLNKLIDIENYLQENKKKGVKAFKTLIEKANSVTIEFVLLTFTHQNIEAYLKSNQKFDLDESFFGVLSKSKLDKLSDYQYDQESQFEDYEYWKFQEFMTDLIEIWLLSCYQSAIKTHDTNSIKYYFKQNHDSLEILELNSCEEKFEKTEFECYTKNNRMNLLSIVS